MSTDTRTASGAFCPEGHQRGRSEPSVRSGSKLEIAEGAVDISYSMDTDEQELQREGFAEAFRSPLVHDAIRQGMLGRIGVTYMEWAGSADQKVIVPRTVLDNSESLMAFADRIASTPLRRAQRTSV